MKATNMLTRTFDFKSITIEYELNGHIFAGKMETCKVWSRLIAIAERTENVLTSSLPTVLRQNIVCSPI